MKPAAFDYVAPSTLDEAITILNDNPDAKIISGGQSLMPLLAFRLAAPSILVDLRNIPDLDHIEISEGEVRLGARVRWVDIEKDERLRTAHPLLARAIEHVAHYQVRNRGTVGGSCCHADPAAEMPGIAVACDAIMVIAGPSGVREIDAASFFAGALQTNLEEAEILVAVRLPRFSPGRRWGFEEFARRRGDFAIAGVLVHFEIDDHGRISDAHVGAIGVGDVARRIGAAEDALNGCLLDPQTIEAAGLVASEDIEPMDDIHAGSDYRRALYAKLLQRVLHVIAGE